MANSVIVRCWDPMASYIIPPSPWLKIDKQVILVQLFSFLNVLSWTFNIYHTKWDLWIWDVDVDVDFCHFLWALVWPESVRMPECSRPARCQTFWFYKGVHTCWWPVNQVHLIESNFPRTVKTSLIRKYGSYSWKIIVTAVKNKDIFCSCLLVFVHSTWDILLCNFLIMSLLWQRCIEMGTQPGTITLGYLCFN